MCSENTFEYISKEANELMDRLEAQAARCADNLPEGLRGQIVEFGFKIAGHVLKMDHAHELYGRME